MDFGEDAAGQIYVVSLAGPVYRIACDAACQALIPPPPQPQPGPGAGDSGGAAPPSSPAAAPAPTPLVLTLRAGSVPSFRSR